LLKVIAPNAPYFSLSWQRKVTKESRDKKIAPRTLASARLRFLSGYASAPL
jgi:hypothetical protein